MLGDHVQFTPLSQEETLELLRRAKNKDEDAKNKLVAGNFPLIKAVLKRYQHKGVEYDVAHEALKSIADEEQLQHAVLIARKKVSVIKNTTDRKKLFRQVTEMLVRKGYPWEIAKKAYNIVMGEFSE